MQYHTGLKFNSIFLSMRLNLNTSEFKDKSLNNNFSVFFTNFQVSQQIFQNFSKTDRSYSGVHQEHATPTFHSEWLIMVWTAACHYIFNCLTNNYNVKIAFNTLLQLQHQLNNWYTSLLVMDRVHFLKSDYHIEYTMPGNQPKKKEF